MSLNFLLIWNRILLLYIFWRPQPTLPCFGLQYSISKKTRTTVSLSSMQGVPSLRFVNRHGGTLRRAGWVAFTKTYSRGKWLVWHLPPTFAIIIHIPRPLRPCIWRPRVPVPHVPASHTWCPQSQVPTHASRCPHPLVPVPLLYTADRQWLIILHTFELVTLSFSQFHAQRNWPLTDALHILFSTWDYYAVFEAWCKKTREFFFHCLFC